MPESRPEYYDFDLFDRAGQVAELENQLLTELTYTVFDMETTGLNPSEGDEILSIGAIRIVNCRLLREERFEQLVDPLRPIPWESVQIHGIHPAFSCGRNDHGRDRPARRKHFPRPGDSTIAQTGGSCKICRYHSVTRSQRTRRRSSPHLYTANWSNAN